MSGEEIVGIVVLVALFVFIGVLGVIERRRWNRETELELELLSAREEQPPFELDFDREFMRRRAIECMQASEDGDPHGLRDLAVVYYRAAKAQSEASEESREVTGQGEEKARKLKSKE